MHNESVFSHLKETLACVWIKNLIGKKGKRERKVNGYTDSNLIFINLLLCFLYKSLPKSLSEYSLKENMFGNNTIPLHIQQYSIMFLRIVIK